MALNEHIVSSYEDELTALRSTISQMGGMVEQAFQDSVTVLLRLDHTQARELRQRDKRIDEMQQRIELQSLAIATGLVSALYMAGGLLQSAGLVRVAGEDAMIWVFPLVSAVYGVARGLVARRYE